VKPSKVEQKKPLKSSSAKEVPDASTQKALAEMKAAQAAAAAAAEKRALSIEEKYMGLIQASIRSQWINQFDPLADLQVTLQIELDSKGNVESVEVSHSSGNSAFDRQAIAAVKKASPLPIPEDPSIAKDFRDLTLPFRNQGI
jgi:colicin import membrane protein